MCATPDINACLYFYFRLFPDESNMATTLGLLYMKTGEYHKAFINFGIALAHDPTCANALVATGVMLQVILMFYVKISKQFSHIFLLQLQQQVQYTVSVI